MQTRQTGFTLIETMIVMVIMMGLVLVFLSMTDNQFKVDLNTRAHAAANAATSSTESALAIVRGFSNSTRMCSALGLLDSVNSGAEAWIDRTGGSDPYPIRRTKDAAMIQSVRLPQISDPVGTIELFKQGDLLGDPQLRFDFVALEAIPIRDTGGAETDLYSIQIRFQSYKQGRGGLSSGPSRSISAIGSSYVERKVNLGVTVKAVENSGHLEIRSCSSNSAGRDLFALVDAEKCSHDAILSGSTWSCPAGKLYRGYGINHECCSLQDNAEVTLHDSNFTWIRTPLVATGSASPSRVVCPSNSMMTGVCRDSTETSCGNGGTGVAFEVKCTQYSAADVRLLSTGTPCAWKRRCEMDEAPTGGNGQTSNSSEISDQINGLSSSSFNAVRCCKMMSRQSF